MRLSFVLLLVIGETCFCQQVGFTMTRGKKEGTYVNFQNVATNINGDLSQEVGAFRCSSPGLYYFSFTGIAPRKETVKVSLRKNRIPIVTLFSSDGIHSSVSGSMVLWLVRNDIVYPFIEDGEIFESNAKTRSMTSFSGFKIGSSGKGRPDNDNMFREDIITSEIGEADPNDKIFTMFRSSRSLKPRCTSTPPPVASTEPTTTEDAKKP